MADIVDIAAESINNELSRAIDRIRQNASPVTMGPKTCVECGEDIPEVRRKLGFKLCVPCAEESERRQSLFNDYKI